jgi:hypothetical protein
VRQADRTGRLAIAARGARKRSDLAFTFATYSASTHVGAGRYEHRREGMSPAAKPRKSIMKKALILASVLSVVAFSSFAQAPAHEQKDTQFQKTHPRREQVNHRLANQNKRIKQEVKEGDMSKAQAAHLHQEDHQIRQEERLMASQNGGHITRQEQKTLNQQENKVSRQIGQ